MTAKKTYDVLIIGGGPAGYVAAIRCAQLGFNTGCVERWVSNENKPALGGTCLNVGCIPSKALLDSSHHFEFLQKESSAHGIEAEAAIDVAKMMARKDKIVSGLTQGIAGLFKKNKVDWLQGSACFKDPKTVIVTNTSGEDELVGATHFIIASGSVPIELECAKIDSEHIVDSSGALSFAEIPERACVIGAGVIGLELGSVWRRLGTDVTVLEASPNFLPTTDLSISKEALKIFKRQGLDIKLGAKVLSAGLLKKSVEVKYQIAGSEKTENFDKVIVAVGRRANTSDLGLDKVAISTNERGFIEVDDLCRTSVENIYAIGDCVRGPMLAHKASEEGVSVAEHLAGQKSHIDFNNVPWVIYTWPEIAWVGKNEQQLTQESRAFKSGVFPFLASGRAHAMGDNQGFVKVIADANTDSILGVHIIGANASELIAEAVLAMEFGASAEDLARTIHGHPTLSESLHEAALAVDSRAIHF
jgi:dihydrolipoamide dehydrogenase